MSEPPPPPPERGGAAAGVAATAAEAGEAPPQGEKAGSFYEAKHVAFIRGLMDKTDSFEHVVMEHLKVREETFNSEAWPQSRGQLGPPLTTLPSLPPSLPLLQSDVRRLLQCLCGPTLTTLPSLPPSLPPSFDLTRCPPFTGL